MGEIRIVVRHQIPESEEHVQRLKVVVAEYFRPTDVVLEKNSASTVLIIEAADSIIADIRELFSSACLISMDDDEMKDLRMLQKYRAEFHAFMCVKEGVSKKEQKDRIINL